MQVQKNHILTRTRGYDLHRETDVVTIVVAEVLAGRPHKFVAYPVDGLGGPAPERFHGKGAAEEEALDACIRAIEKLPWKEIFPRDEMWPKPQK